MKNVELGRFFKLQLTVNGLVVESKRDVGEVARVLQLINDDPLFIDKIAWPSDEPEQTEDFRVIEELDLPVDYSISPDVILRASNTFCDRLPPEKYTYIGELPELGTRTVRLVIGTLHERIAHLRYQVAQQEEFARWLREHSFADAGAWTAFAYIDFRAKYNKKVGTIFFAKGLSSRWQHPDYYKPDELRETGEILVSKQKSGPWVNVCSMCAGAFGFSTVAFISTK